MNNCQGTLEKQTPVKAGALQDLFKQLPELTPEQLAIEPLERALTIPSAWYTHPAFFAWEREAIFARSWHYAGPISKLQQPGDFFILEVAQNPIIVTRGKDNQIRAFYNVCRHRGGPLAYQDGNDTVLQCKYHGFTYDLCGSLIGTPDFQGVECFEKANYGLQPLQVQEWESHLFVHLEAEPFVGLDVVLEGIANRILPIDLKAMRFHRRVVYQVNSNWKTYVDNYLEGFHVPYVHPELTDMLDFRNYTTEVHPWYSLQHSPLQVDSDCYGSKDGSIFYYFVYPNMMLNIMPNRLQLNVVVPVSPDTCEVIFDYYYAGLEGEALERRSQADEAFSELVQQQDIDICQAVQKGLASRSYDQGRLSVKRESALYLFQNQIKEAYERAIAEAQRS